VSVALGGATLPACTPDAPPAASSASTPIPAHAAEQEPIAAAIAALRAAPTPLESSSVHTDSSTGRFLILDAANEPVTGVLVNRDSRGVIGEIEVLAHGLRHGPHVHWTSEEGAPMQAGWWHHGDPVGLHRRWYRPHDGGAREFVGVLAGPLGGPFRVEYAKDGTVTSSSHDDGGKQVPDSPPVDHWATYPDRPAWADTPPPRRPDDLPIVAPN
jgi:hypothetical protein